MAATYPCNFEGIVSHTHHLSLDVYGNRCTDVWQQALITEHLPKAQSSYKVKLGKTYFSYAVNLRVAKEDESISYSSTNKKRLEFVVTENNSLLMAQLAVEAITWHEYLVGFSKPARKVLKLYCCRIKLSLVVGKPKTEPLELNQKSSRRRGHQYPWIRINSRWQICWSIHIEALCKGLEWQTHFQLIASLRIIDDTICCSELETARGPTFAHSDFVAAEAFHECLIIESPGSFGHGCNWYWLGLLPTTGEMRKEIRMWSRRTGNRLWLTMIQGLTVTDLQKY